MARSITWIKPEKAETLARIYEQVGTHQFMSHKIAGVCAYHLPCLYSRGYIDKVKRGQLAKRINSEGKKVSDTVTIWRVTPLGERYIRSISAEVAK